MTSDKEIQMAKEQFAKEELQNEANTLKGRKHNCKEAKCTVDQQGKKI